MNSQSLPEQPARHSSDVIDKVLDITPDTELARLRGVRPELVAGMQGSFDAVMVPNDPGGLPHDLRAALACRIALQNDDPVLAAHFRAMLKANDDSDVLAAISRGEEPSGTPASVAAIVRHSDLLSQSPKDVTRADIEALTTAGISDADIVRLSELAALISFQVRVIAGLRVLGASQ